MPILLSLPCLVARPVQAAAEARSGSVPRSPASFEGVGRSIMHLPPLARTRRTPLSVTLCLVLAAGVMPLWHGAAIASHEQPGGGAPAPEAAKPGDVQVQVPESPAMTPVSIG